MIGKSEKIKNNIKIFESGYLKNGPAFEGMSEELKSMAVTVEDKGGKTIIDGVHSFSERKIFEAYKSKDGKFYSMVRDDLDKSTLEVFFPVKMERKVFDLFTPNDLLYSNMPVEFLYNNGEFLYPFMLHSRHGLSVFSDGSVASLSDNFYTKDIFKKNGVYKKLNREVYIKDISPDSKYIISDGALLDSNFKEIGFKDMPKVCSFVRRYGSDVAIAVKGADRYTVPMGLSCKGVEEFLLSVINAKNTDMLQPENIYKTCKYLANYIPLMSFLNKNVKSKTVLNLQKDFAKAIKKQEDFSVKVWKDLSK